MAPRGLEVPTVAAKPIAPGGQETNKVRTTSIGETAHIRVSARTANMQAGAPEITSASYHNAPALGHRKAPAARIASGRAVGYDISTRRTLP